MHILVWSIIYQWPSKHESLHYWALCGQNQLMGFILFFRNNVLAFFLLLFDTSSSCFAIIFSIQILFCNNIFAFLFTWVNRFPESACKNVPCFTGLSTPGQKSRTYTNSVLIITEEQFKKHQICQTTGIPYWQPLGKKSAFNIT